MSYGHSIQKIGQDHFRLGWVVDFKCSGSRLRFPRSFARDTDEAGARRFAKHWNIRGPETVKQRDSSLTDRCESKFSGEVNQ